MPQVPDSKLLKNMTHQMNRAQAIRELGVPAGVLAVLMALLSTGDRWVTTWWYTPTLALVVTALYVGSFWLGFRRLIARLHDRSALSTLVIVGYALVGFGIPIDLLLNIRSTFEVWLLPIAAMAGFVMLFLLQFAFLAIDRLVESRKQKTAAGLAGKLDDMQWVGMPLATVLVIGVLLLVAPFTDHQLSLPWLFVTVTMWGTGILYLVQRIKDSP